MVSEVSGTKRRVVVLGRVVHIVLVRLTVGVDLDVVVSIVGEEQTVPCSLFLGVCVLLVAEGLVLGFIGCSLCNV